MSSEANNLLDSITSKQAETRFLVKVLQMWECVKAQGIDPETVKCFGFDPQLIEPAVKQQLRRRMGMGQTTSNPYNWPISTGEDGRRFIKPQLYNYVKLKDDSRVTLNPPIKSAEFAA